jgi:Mn-dependent DtxR family transcriptional regulator
MCPRIAPSPSRAAERLKEYLDIFDSTKAKERGKTLWYDIYRRAGNQWQTEQMIKYLEDNGLIEGDKSEGYYKTEKGEIWHDILRKHSDLVGVLTRELSGDRRKRL